ncbi:MAG: glycosyltransferase family 4 protein, partial [Candidatus Binatia bacterium]
MRVGYVSCDPGVSVFGSTGSSVHITEICTALGTLGHEVFVLSARRGGLPSARPTFDVHEIEIAPIHRLSSRILRSLSSAWNTHNVREQAQRLSSPPKLLKKSTIYQDLKQVLRHWLYSESFLKEARRIIRRRDPDVLYERYGFGSYVGVKLARGYRLPLILEMNASLSFEGGAYYRRSKLFRIVVRHMEREIALGADNIIVVSDANKRYLLGLGIPESRIYVVP